MDDSRWLKHQLEEYCKHLIISFDMTISKLVKLKDLIEKTSSLGKKVFFAGNGGSAALASHCAVDFTKCAGIRSVNFNEAVLITCFANDYGYGSWLEKALRVYADDGDMVILISSSGKSPNMIHAAKYANERELLLATFTGFDQNNPLKSLGQINFWVDSRDYNVVEMTHHSWLLAICDLLIHKKKKSLETSPSSIFLGEADEP